MAVYGGRLHVAGNVGRYHDRFSPFFASSHLLIRISYYVSQNYLKHVYDCFLMKFIEEINLFIKLQQLLFYSIEYNTKSDRVYFLDTQPFYDFSELN
jgi:hypothetical protein